MSYQRHLIANEIALLSANEMSYQRHLIANENTPVSIVTSPDEQQRENDTQKTTTTTKTNKQKTTKQHTHTLRVFYMFGKSDH